MKEGTYKVTLEFELLKELQPETLDKFFRTIINKSGSMVFLHMADPIAADSEQSRLEALITESIRKAMLEESLGRTIASAGGFKTDSFDTK